MPSTIKEKVSTLERVLERSILNTDKTLNHLAKEMEAFKEEMKVFKDEVRADIEESKQSTKAFKEEMKVFKDEVRANIEESKKDRKAMNKKWGDLANRLGTFAEDIAAPNIPRIAKEYFGASDILQSWTNHRVKHPSKKGFEYEFDAVVETDEKVFLLETKYTIRDEYIKNMPTLIQNFKECLRVFAAKELIPIFASMSLHESTIRRLSKMGVYAMVMGDETMELVNFEAVQGRNRGLVDE